MEGQHLGAKGIFENKDFPFILVNDQYFSRPPDSIRDKMGPNSLAYAAVMWNLDQILPTTPPTTKPPKHTPVWSFGLPDTWGISDEIPSLPKVDVQFNISNTPSL